MSMKLLHMVPIPFGTFIGQRQFHLFHCRHYTDHKTDVAVIGAGFTGLSAAYHLGQAGVDVTVMDAQHPMFGATGRNGGFCCLGGGKISNARLDRLYGSDQRQLYRQAEKAAVDLVDQFISDHDLDVDRHSDGETLLAHKPKHAQDFPALQAEIQRDYGVTAEILGKTGTSPKRARRRISWRNHNPHRLWIEPKNMPADCYKWHKQRCQILCQHTRPAHCANDIGIRHRNPKRDSILQQIHHRHKWLFIRGYVSMDARTLLPVQSSVIVTRPITDQEQTAQGWTSAQMAYDSRFLLHYFRMMPNNRFLFGMRGDCITQNVPTNGSVKKSGAILLRCFRVA